MSTSSGKSLPMHSYLLSDAHLLHRTSDVQLLLAVSYPLAFSFAPALSEDGTLGVCFAHALAWALFHTFGLGLLLRAQSQRKFLVRHFLQNYHYPHHDGGKGAVLEAFSNWKQLYNLSMCMTYGENPCYSPGWASGKTNNFCSILLCAGVEDIFYSDGLDSR